MDNKDYRNFVARRNAAQERVVHTGSWFEFQIKQVRLELEKTDLNEKQRATLNTRLAMLDNTKPKGWQ